MNFVDDSATMETNDTGAPSTHKLQFLGSNNPAADAISFWNDSPNCLSSQAHATFGSDNKSSQAPTPSGHKSESTTEITPFKDTDDLFDKLMEEEQVPGGSGNEA